MIRFVLRATLALSLVFTATAPLLAQEDEEEARPKKRVKREEAPSVQGRNDALREAFKGLAAKSSHVVKVGSGAFGVILEGNVIVTTAAAAKGASVKVTGAAGTGDARVIGVDDRNGIALLQAPFDAKGIAIAGDDLIVGQFVVTIGTSADRPLCAGVLSAKNRRVEPRDLSQANILMGLMSDGIDGPKRAYAKVLQHDAPMTDETLGSALLDSEGKLVGINVGTGYRGSSYALSAADLSASVAAIKAGKVLPPVEKKPEAPKKPVEMPKPVAPEKVGGKPYLGASIKASDESGLLIDELAHGGPALEAGLRPGDKITAIDGTKVTTLDELAEKIGSHQGGEKVTLTVLRGKKSVQIEVTLGKR